MINNIESKYFFYIDSDNFNDITDSCYGFNISYTENKITLSDNINSNIIGGSYIIVQRNNDVINIITDDISSLYIFYYISDDFYAVSNSFYRMAEILKSKNKVMTLNKLFIHQYIDSPLHTHSLYNTLINEIKILPIFTDIVLSKNQISFIKKDIDIHCIDIDSEQGQDIINKWINKWSDIIYSLHKSDIPIRIDLSGGFDSRIIFALAKYGGVDFNKDTVNIYSKIATNIGLKNHLEDDYEIATLISERLNFQLNKNPKIFNTEYIKYSSNNQYFILKNLFMGFHKEGYLCTCRYNTPHIHIGGINGEVIRGALPDMQSFNNRFYANPFNMYIDDVKTEFYKDIELIEGDQNITKLVKFFLNTQCRSHFGMSIYNDYINNTYFISPFNDKELYKLNFKNRYRHNLIFAIILYKTCPEIFDICFNKGISFSDDVKQLTISLSNKYPLIKNTHNYNIEIINNDIINNIPDNNNGEYILYQIFKENKNLFIEKFGELFNKEYAENIYKYADDFYINKDNFYPNKWVVCITSIIEVLKILYE